MNQFFIKSNQTVEKWVELFNSTDAYSLAELYSDNAISHQVAILP